MPPNVQFFLQAAASHLARVFITLIAAWCAKRGYEASGESIEQVIAWLTTGFMLIGSTAWSVWRAKQLRDAPPPPPEKGGPTK